MVHTEAAQSPEPLHDRTTLHALSSKSLAVHIEAAQAPIPSHSYAHVPELQTSPSAQSLPQ